MTIHEDAAKVLRERYITSPVASRQELEAAITAFGRRCAEAMREECKKIEARYRHYLWLNHGCPSAGLYGDDGEMQCNNGKRHGYIDFKREPLGQVECRLEEMKLRQLKVQP